MTVALLAKWGDQPPGTLYTSDSTTEAAMVTAKVATATLTGAVAWVKPGSSPGSQGEPFSRAESDALRGVVSEARITTWANRAALLPLGLTSAFFTDVGVGGSFWDYNGGRWRPSARSVTLKNLITAVSNSAAPKVVLDYCTLLAGIWQDGDILEIDVLKTREGGTADTDATDLMIGTAPATLGTSTGFSSSALATTTIQFVMRHRLRRESATSIRTLATAGGGGGLGTLTSLTTLTSGLTSLDTTDQYLQITSDLTTAGGEAAWLRGFTVTLVSGA